MIGRNFIKYCVDNNLCTHIRVVDKSIPSISYLSKEHEASFNSPIIEFIQADLTKDSHIERAFKNQDFQFVFNLAAETRYGLDADSYALKCRDLSVKCARRAKEANVMRFIEISTAYVYKSQVKEPASERTGILEPWTLQAQYKLEAEKEISKIEGLDYIILRPAIVYGPADVNGLMPRIVCAVVYKKLKETMKFLWDAKMALNTVHVIDVCSAMWHVAVHGRNREIYNLADKAETDQGKINHLLSKLFDISTGFHGKLVSNLARLRISDVVEEANEKHLKPWLDICHESGIENTPLSPYIEGELLRHNHLFIDGTYIETIGFTYMHPEPTANEVKKCIEQAIEQKIFPPVLKV